MLTHLKGILREGSSILSIIIFSGVIFVLFYAGTIDRENKPSPPEKPTELTAVVSALNPLLTPEPETGPVKIEGRVKRGDTIINILKKHGIVAFYLNQSPLSCSTNPTLRHPSCQ